VPIEVIPEALVIAQQGLRELGAKEIAIRSGSGKHGPVITEGGNIILDASFNDIDLNLEDKIKSITGVVESGLFVGYISEVLIADANGVKSF
jgi:ribose 5-phosphate isomerase A